ncbi:hypothetical protein D3C78_802370 [compost metagenome]
MCLSLHAGRGFLGVDRCGYCSSAATVGGVAHSDTCRLTIRTSDSQGVSQHAVSGGQRSANSDGTELCSCSCLAFDGIGSEIFRASSPNRNADGLMCIGANLEVHVGERTIQHLTTTEGGGVGDTGQFVLQGADFLLQCLAVGGVVGAVGRLQRQVAHALKDVGGLLQSAFSGLRQGDTVVGVAYRHVQAADLAGHTVGDLQAGSIVLGAVDAVAGGQTLQRSAQRVGRAVQVALSVQGSNVRVDGKGHGGLLQRSFSVPERAISRPACSGTPRIRIRSSYRRLFVEL